VYVRVFGTDEMVGNKQMKRRKRAPRGSKLRVAINKELQPHHDRDPVRMYRVAELAALLHVHQQTLWQWARTGQMPKPIKLGRGVTAWPAVTIEDWIAAKAGAGE
jgi:predicted DNA-binding transcriptional regulator AlpA